MENNSFEYTYSAQQQQEVEAIRRKYLPREENKLDQLRKLHNVRKVEVLDDDCIKRELMLVKVRYDSSTRADILSAVEVYRAKVIDYTVSEMCIEITGDPLKIEAFIKLMIPFGIIELCRTGIVALDRGSTTLLGKNER